MAVFYRTEKCCSVIIKKQVCKRDGFLSEFQTDRTCPFLSPSRVVVQDAFGALLPELKMKFIYVHMKAKYIGT